MYDWSYEPYVMQKMLIFIMDIFIAAKALMVLDHRRSKTFRAYSVCLTVDTTNRRKQLKCDC